MLKENLKIDTQLSQEISAEQAYHYRIIPYERNGRSIKFWTDSQEIASLSQELSIVLDKEVLLERIASSLLQDYLTANYRISSSQKNNNLHYTPDFLDQLLLRAKELGSSDIHFEPYEKSCRIRFRLDGKLSEQFRISVEEYPIIINKIKVRSGLDIAEKRLPQDGRIGIDRFGEEFDLRVSTLPTLYGEKIVLRVLNRNADAIALEKLGLQTDELERYLEGIKSPHGIVLISGPTGSGKTTTLYATMRLLNNSQNNILTIEDPIEYMLEGINQVQLKENIGLDFSSALRTFLRQDPDIIMVGEIRDVKTANMAIRAALTGHLVLSTIHTNSAWGTISRLIDMGVPPFLLASTLNLSVAQRLVRKLCIQCKQSRELTNNDLPKGYHIPEKLSTHHIPVGCPECHHTGYKGRAAIYEILPIKADLIPMIKANELQIDSYLNANRIRTLSKNALDLVQKGITSVEEVYSILSN